MTTPETITFSGRISAAGCTLTVNGRVFDLMKFRKPRKTIAAAVSIDPNLYELASKHVSQQDTNFSRYVRDLIRRDLSNPQRLKLQTEAGK